MNPAHSPSDRSRELARLDTLGQRFDKALESRDYFSLACLIVAPHLTPSTRKLPMSELISALVALKHARETEATLKAALKVERDAFEANHAATIGAVTEATAARELAETTVRGLAVATYLETGNKAPTNGVSVVESTKLKYDPATAFEWATEHKVALALDAKAFEKIAKATPLPFVMTEVTPTARIATDLSDV